MRMGQAERLSVRRMKNYSVFDDSIDRSDDARTSTGAARTLRRHVRVIDAGMIDELLAVPDPHEAQQIQSGEEDAE